MPVNHYYVRALNGTDAPGGGGSHATAYKTIQYALDDIGATHGKGAQGDQVNICDEATNYPAAALSLAAYGVPASGAPLILRGYTATANDGGRGSISRPGGSIISGGTISHTHLRDLVLTGGVSTTPLVRLGDYCELTSLEMIPTGFPVYYALSLGSHCRVIGNTTRYIAGVGQFAYGCYSPGSGLVWGNYWDGSWATGNEGSIMIGNICLVRTMGYNGLGAAGSHSVFIGNIVYSLVANNYMGILMTAFTDRRNSIAVNNIVCGYSGAGGRGIGTYATEQVWMAGHNAYWNNTTNYYAGETYIDLTANDIQLTADPFVDAPNGDFTLTKAARAALSAKGFPLSYLGAHANTVPNVTIGAMQMPNGGGGAVNISPLGRGL